MSDTDKQKKTLKAGNSNTKTPPPNLPKRFYKDVSLSFENQAYHILLDNKPVKTPLKTELAVPCEALALMIVQEWDAQDTFIDPCKMPFTKLANTALDRVMQHRDMVVDDIVKYADSDLLCYRADMPDALIKRQNTLWDPVLTWLKQDYDIIFRTSSGIIYAEQSAETIEKVRQIIAAYDTFHLCPIHNITTLTGSVLLALSFIKGQMTAEEIWLAAHVDEDWQIENWGEDEDAMYVREQKWLELEATCQFFKALDS